MKAHKGLLSLVSPVFSNLFFIKGVKREEKNQLDDLDMFMIEGQRFTSFRTFIRFLYSGEEEELHDLDLSSLVDIFLLANQYQIRGMKQLIRSLIQKLEMKETGLLDIFKVLLKHHTNFICEEICADIYSKCLAFLKAEKWWYTKVEAQKYLEEKIGRDTRMKKIIGKVLANFDLEGEKTKQAEEIAKGKLPIVEVEMSVDEEPVGSVREITGEIRGEKVTPSDIVDETESIILKCVPIGGYPEVKFRIGPTTKMVRLMKEYSNRTGSSLDQIRFHFNQKLINRDDTPQYLGLVDGDVIIVILRFSGD